MPGNYTPRARANIAATSADEPLLMLLEIDHKDLDIPVRVVRDTQDITLHGDLYQLCEFECTLPDDVDGQVPKAQLKVDNIGRDLTQWMDVSNGGNGATCRIIQMLRSEPDTIQYELTMDLTGLSIDQYSLTGELGFTDTLNLPAVAIRFDPRTAPGLF